MMGYLSPLNSNNIYLALTLVIHVSSSHNSCELVAYSLGSCVEDGATAETSCD